MVNVNYLAQWGLNDLYAIVLLACQASMERLAVTCTMLELSTGRPFQPDRKVMCLAGHYHFQLRASDQILASALTCQPMGSVVAVVNRQKKAV